MFSMGTFCIFQKCEKSSFVIPLAPSTCRIRELRYTYFLQQAWMFPPPLQGLLETVNSQSARAGPAPQCRGVRGRAGGRDWWAIWLTRTDMCTHTLAQQYTHPQNKTPPPVRGLTTLGLFWQRLWPEATRGELILHQSTRVLLQNRVRDGYFTIVKCVIALNDERKVFLLRSLSLETKNVFKVKPIFIIVGFQCCLCT